MNQFLPSTPRQRDFSNPLLELRESKVCAWIGALPLHDPIEAIARLQEVLAPLNQDPLGEKERLRLLEHYRTPVLALHDAWDHLQRRLAELPLPQRQAVEAQLSELLWQLAGGYKIIVRRGHDAGRSPAKDGPLLLALYRTLEALGIVLLDAYRRYAAVPPHTFRELNQCYRFAETHRVQTQAAPLDRKTRTAHTLDELFKRALLLAAADPFHLPAGHAARLDRLLVQHARHCDLAPPPWQEAAGRFVVDLRDDRAPQPCAKATPDALSPTAWILDVNPLCSALQQLIDEANDPERALQELEVLRRLLPNLRTPPKRRTPRTQSTKELRVATGLAAVHHFLTEAGEAQLRSSATHAAYGIEVYDAESESQMAYQLEPWKVINESPKGYRLARRHALDAQLRVGEALGLFPLQPSERRAPEIGIVRWIQRGAEGWVQIGVEILPGHPAAVRCTPLDPHEAPFAEPLAVYLQRVPNLPIPPTLLARRSLYRKGCAIALAIGAQRGRAAIGSLVLETDCLARLSLKPLRQ